MKNTKTMVSVCEVRGIVITVVISINTDWTPRQLLFTRKETKWFNQRARELQQSLLQKKSGTSAEGRLFHLSCQFRPFCSGYCAPPRNNSGFVIQRHDNETIQVRTSYWISHCLTGRATYVSYVKHCQVKPWRRMEEWMYRATFYWPRQQLEVSSQLHAQAALPRGNIRRYPLDRRLGGFQSRFGRRGEEKILDSTGTRTLTPRPSSP
jgi:hypothetical protein